MAEVEVVDSEDDAFLEGRRADIKQTFKKSLTKNATHIGVFGEIHPEVILNFGLDHPVVGFEMDIGSSNAGEAGGYSSFAYDA